MKLTEKDFEQARKYRATKPKQFGNLHERMKFLMEKIEGKHSQIPNEIWQAIFDLETEVEYHTPANPPFGRRILRLS